MRLTSKSLTVPVPIEHYGVEYRHSRVAGISLKIGWGINTSHAECEQLSIDRWILLSSLLGACAY